LCTLDVPHSYLLVALLRSRLPLILLLFLQSSVAPPSLHSFPTRRSSDLITSKSRGTIIWAADEVVYAPEIAVARLRRSRGRTPPDRKSTRLNSSHGSISYAVFCLKKKKK